jgi:hypothetical protein
MTDRIDDDTDLTQAVVSTRSACSPRVDPDNALIVSWQNQAASPNAAHAARTRRSPKPVVLLDALRSRLEALGNHNAYVDRGMKAVDRAQRHCERVQR